MVIVNKLENLLFLVVELIVIIEETENSFIDFSDLLVEGRLNRQNINSISQLFFLLTREVDVHCVSIKQKNRVFTFHVESESIHFFARRKVFQRQDGSILVFFLIENKSGFHFLEFHFGLVVNSDFQDNLFTMVE